VPNRSAPDDRGPGTRDRDGGSSRRLGSPLVTALFWIALVGLVVYASRSLRDLGEPPLAWSYSEFLDAVSAERVESVTIDGSRIEGRLAEAVETQVGETTVSAREFVTHAPAFGDPRLLERLERHGVEVRAEPADEGTLWPLLLSVLPFLLLLWLFFAFVGRMRQQGEQMMLGMGRSHARRYQKSTESTGFDDVAGAEGVKTELREIVDFLKEPARFQRLGGKPPKGILLVGPPGTGKTLLARAAAGEAGVPFFSITGSGFMEMLVGVGASRVRDLFKDARRSAPAIVFIDELDSIGRRRGAGLGGGHDEREQTLNQLLSEMDGFEPNQGVIVMAATNRPDILDPALLRPGRFDRRVTVELPGLEARTAILRIHTRRKPIAPDVDLHEVARATPGFSGADLENLLNEAALLAARGRKDAIGVAEIEDARDKILLGLEREGLALTREECRLLAFHESGHAVVAAVLPHADPLHKVSIVPRGQALGGTQQLPEKDRYVLSRDYLLDRLAVMLGGRAAEELRLESVTSGAEQDLREATRIARKMVLDWGMSRRFAHTALGGPRENVFLGEELGARREYSETTAHEADQEVRNILEDAHRRALDVLREHAEGLDRLAEALLEHEELAGRRVLEILGVDREPQDEPQAQPA